VLLFLVPNAAYCAAVSETILVIAAAPVIPVVVLGITPETSADVSVTTPVRPATLVTAADTVPLDTLKPVPTITPPRELVVAAGNVYEPPPSVRLTILPAAFFVNALASVQFMASSFVSKSLVVGTELAV
jgi:hypothetical protein